jgi:hypothetical protein
LIYNLLYTASFVKENDELVRQIFKFCHTQIQRIIETDYHIEKMDPSKVSRVFTMEYLSEMSLKCYIDCALVADKINVEDFSYEFFSQVSANLYADIGFCTV